VETTYYDILEVSPRASAETIKAAYKSLVQRHHPDKNSDASAAEHMKRLNVAYEVLSDPVKRQQYDEKLRSSSYQADPSPTDAPPKAEKETNSGYSSGTGRKPPPSTGNRKKDPAALQTAGYWRRYFARKFDLLLEISVVLVVFSFAYKPFFIGNPEIAKYIASTIKSSDVNNFKYLWFPALVVLCSLMIDSCIYAFFTNTPGKALLGIKCSSPNGRLTASEYFMRNISLFFSGLACGTAFGWMAAGWQCYRVSHGRPASYDEKGGVIVQCRKDQNDILTGLFVIVFLVLMV